MCECFSPGQIFADAHCQWGYKLGRPVYVPHNPPWNLRPTSMLHETGPSGTRSSLYLRWTDAHLGVRHAYLGHDLLDGYYIRRRALNFFNPGALSIRNSCGQESPW
jgi:hypothetical protein